MQQLNNWYDVDDVLYDGTKEEIENIVCPDCGKKISYRYSDGSNSFEVSCKLCGHISRATGSPKPNCVIYFGNEYDFRK
ncbi:MAG TPA: hypothetical protein PLO83_11385 [Gammaproteobacteria bacterium]|nr:hypothetical protein [Gammaproteobacteria bacterium]HPF29804.1 hypothetical protein [Lachnospiraceae bacterium]